MINLLPPDIRQDIFYARRNTKLIRWMTALLIGIIGIVAIVVFGQLYINSSIHALNGHIETERNQLEIQKLVETQKQVQEISNNLKLVVQVLSREVLFSKLLKQIGSVMPRGTSLAELSINKLQGGIDLKAITTDYQAATQVQVNLEDPANKIFEKVDIVNIDCSSRSNNAYPCQATYRASFAKDNPFLLIGPKTTTTGATR